MAFGVPGFSGIAQQASLYQMQATDMQQAQTIYTQIAADAKKNQLNRWQIMRNVQTKAFEITQSVTINKMKAAQKVFQQFNQVISS